MPEDPYANLSDEVKSTVANHANEWAITNFHALEKLRRNLMIGSLAVSIIGLTGIPETIEIAGIQLNKAPNYLFYIVAISIVLYLSWTYYALIESAELLGKYYKKLHLEVLGFDLWSVEIDETKTKQIRRQLYKYYSPAVAAFLSIAIILGRMIFEYFNPAIASSSLG